MGITTKEKANSRIDVFVQKYGNGKVGLTESQKDARIEKVIGSTEIEKVKGFGSKLNEGVDIKIKKKNVYSENFGGMQDPIHSDVIKNLSKYPNWQGKKTQKVYYTKVGEDGSITIDGIIINGKEQTPEERAGFSIFVLGDEDSARNEIQQHKKGILKEVSDRTMAIHKENNNLQPLLDDENIDTDEDKINQI